MPRPPVTGARLEEFLPRLERESLRVDEEDFRRKFAAFLNLRAAQGPGDTPARP